MERKEVLITTRGKRELYRVEIEDPSGSWHTYFSGVEFIVVDGVRRDLPTKGHITFKTEAEGLDWTNAPA